MTKQKKVRGCYQHPKGSGVYWILWYDQDGQRHREKAGTKGAAIQLYGKRKEEARVGKKLPENLRALPVAFKEIAESALEYSRTEKAPGANDDYRMAPLLEEFGTRPAEVIRPEEFENWLNEQAEKRQWAQATKNRYIALLKLTYRLAEKNGKIKSNPARHVRMRKEDNARVRYLNQYKPLPTEADYLKPCLDEESRLRAVIAKECPYHLPEFEIALQTGMRRSEQYRCQRSDVDLARRILTVPQSKNGETRHIPLNSTALAIFDFLLSKPSETEHVFLSMRNDNPLTKNRHWFEDAVKKARVQGFTWHCLRHTFASRLIMAGVDLRTVQELMGHKVIAMTCRYAHLAPDHKLAAVERLVSAAMPENRESTAIKTATSENQAFAANPQLVN